MSKILHADLSFRVIGAAIAVHQELGPGLLERIYHSALEVELRDRELNFTSRVPVAAVYRGVRLGFAYEVDILVEDTIVLELKSVAALAPVHSAQLLTYLRLLNCRVGYVLNFNATNLVKRGLQRRVL